MPTLDFKGKQFIYSHHHSVPFCELEVNEKKSLPAKGKKPNLDDNLIIHGDNLHALKDLIPQYAGKIQCIYIDPPYNTGSEGWCYNDNVNSPLMKEWLAKNANPVDREDLQRHDKWLCMMWPRLRLLHELLADDGVIFISIDDNELPNLRTIMDDIWGEENHVGTLKRRAARKAANLAKKKAKNLCDYVVVYCKNELLTPLGISGLEDDTRPVFNAGNKSSKRVIRKDTEARCGDGDYAAGVYKVKSIEFTSHNDFVILNGKLQNDISVSGPFRVDQALIDKTVYITSRLGLRRYVLDEEKDEIKTISDLIDEPEFYNENATDFLKLLFDGKVNFETPKPEALISFLIRNYESGSEAKDIIILDSFAGSGTAAHAVLNLNKEDGGNRKFILVEMEDYADKTTAERVRRVINGVPNAQNEKLKEGLGGSFTFCTLGDEISIEKIITGEALPDYGALAKYVFYTATGHSLDKESKSKPDYFVGETDLYEVYLIYKPDIAFLRGNESALNDAKLEVIAERDSKKEKLVFATSATPKDHSNLLVNVGGKELKKEQMIKLPINVIPYDKSNWQHTLNQAHAKLSELGKAATKYQADKGKYIRPIMLIKAEPKKKDDAYDHVADIKAYLMKHLSVLESEIRIKLADNNELGDEDLFDKLCPVRYIITKDALKEGWDCSFAYVLAILSNSKSETALTQFIGRVLRQPYAHETSIPALNQCYVYCDNADVNIAATAIKKGLEEEGMGDVSDQIVTGNAQAMGKEKATLKRQAKYQQAKIFLPSLNAIRDGKLTTFDYYADVLGDVRWDDYKFDALDNLTLADKEAMDYQHLTVDWQRGETGQLDFQRGQRQSEQVTNEINLTLMVSQLMDKVPNAWQAYRIIEGVLAGLRKKKISDMNIALNSVFIVEEIKKNAFQWMLEQSEAIFRRKLDNGRIFLHLLATPFEKLNWQMAETVEVPCNVNESPVTLAKSMFQPQYRSNYNGLEYLVALAINNKDVVEWWHRLAVKGTEYSVQGWKREKIYPDFLVKLETGNDGLERLYFIESKGDQLEGNKDTDYKQKLFEVINAALLSDIKPKGEFKLADGKEKISFHMVFESEWDNALNKLFAA